MNESSVLGRQSLEKRVYSHTSVGFDAKLHTQKGMVRVCVCERIRNYVIIVRVSSHFIDQ